MVNESFRWRYRLSLDLVLASLDLLCRFSCFVSIEPLQLLCIVRVVSTSLYRLGFLKSLDLLRLFRIINNKKCDGVSHSSVQWMWASQNWSSNKRYLSAALICVEHQPTINSIRMTTQIVRYQGNDVEIIVIQLCVNNKFMVSPILCVHLYCRRHDNTFI